IVERITESSFPDWMADHIFQPLGMEHTRVRRHPQEIIPHSTQGYASSSEGWREAGDLAAAYGAGGIYTTAGDLAKWLRNFSEPVVGNAAIIQELTTPFVLNNGDTTSYALGIGVGEYRGLREFSHGGADIAHRAFLAYYPDLDAGVILLSNNSGFSVNSHDITGYFFGDQLAEIEEAADAEDQEPSAEEESWSPSPAELEAYAGTYKFEEVDMLIEYRLEGGKLVAQATGQPALTLTPLEKHAFSYAMVDAKVVFDMQPDGHVEMGTHFQGGNEIKLHRVPAFDPSPEALAEFTGDFYCDELQVIYTLFLEEDKLKARQFNAEDIGLSPTEADTFTGDKFYVGSLAFTRDEAGKVTGFTVSNGRTKGVVFTRQD
ncbi:MAG: serine hydrolase, partial [Lewinella sp.]|nr:serine hydrolase [Lewinella sp.]